MELRVGQGFDAHRFAERGTLRLGGVNIPFDRGMLAHSDGDVLLHALIDALLGAAGQGDIGQHFPDNDPAYRGADSRALLRSTRNRITAAGFQLVNCDCTVIAQRPRLASSIPAMRDCIAADLEIQPGRVNVKATTTEQMGFTGRGEGIAAMAVVLLGRD
jgi:2-C-methyl-D-erythritol 2,4-cyclodiphosphate synthase